MADLLENLNDRQREAVLETEGYVRVIAGAGSGKTKLLVSRYAYLVQDYGIDSSNILCVTFTNKAAGEMKKRIRALIGDEQDVSLISTYHGFCNRLLRENPEKLFLNKQFQIIDGHQQKAVLSEIYQKFELKLDYASFESILRKIGYVKRDTGYVTRLCDPQPCQILAEIKDQDDRIIEEFLQRQKATYSLDFHDLISFAIHLLETDAYVREKWQSRLNYIMVDEFQDSSAVEMRLVDILSKQYQNLMIVGDPDQNIYEWRGSDVKLLVDFDKDHVPTQTIILNQNYRSTPQILQCANTLIEKNKLRLKKDLFTKNASGAPVVHYHSKDDYEEMDQVIANINKLHSEEGFKYSDFAIVYRSGFLSRIAEKKLVEKNIPYEIFGGVRFYQRMEILDILAYLKLIAYDDDTCFRRIVNTPRRRFGRAKLNYLEDLREHGIITNDVYQRDLFELYDGNPEKVGSNMGNRSNAGNGPETGNRLDAGDRPDAVKRSSLFTTLSENLTDKEFQNSDIAPFVRFIDAMRKSCKDKRISDIVNEVARDSGYEGYIRELGDEERLDNLAEFKRIANEFEREFGENLSLEEFLQQIALQSDEDENKEKDTVKLMTIHSSKGLEFSVVFILGFTEGVFPSAKTIGARKNLGLEEERRLCYVAMTRAEKYLFLMDSEGVSQNGMKKLVSRFLEEIGENNYIRIGRISEELLQESRGYTARLNRELQTEEQISFRAGDTVEHHIFGRGTIEKVDGRRASCLVKFDKLPQPRNISFSYFMREHEKAQTEQCIQHKPEGDERAEETGKLKADGRAENAGSLVKQAEHADLEDAQQFLMEDAFERSEEDRAQRHREGELNGQQVQVVSGPKGAEMNESGADTEADQADIEVDQTEIEADIIGEDELADYQEEYVESKETESEKEESAETESEEAESEEAGSEKAEPADVGQAAKLKALKENTPNLWKYDEVPHFGWSCVGVEDLGAPVGICEMCGYQIIRYAHQMVHPKYRSLSVGCICAGKMEGNIDEAKRREAEFKNRQTRRINFFKRKWKQSKKGNEYLKIDGHIVVLYKLNRANNSWKYSIDNEFCKTAYPTRDRALSGAFESLEKLKSRS